MLDGQERAQTVLPPALGYRIVYRGRLKGGRRGLSSRDEWVEANVRTRLKTEWASKQQPALPEQRREEKGWVRREDTASFSWQPWWCGRWNGGGWCDGRWKAEEMQLVCARTSKTLPDSSWAAEVIRARAADSPMSRVRTRYPCRHQIQRGRDGPLANIHKHSAIN